MANPLVQDRINIDCQNYVIKVAVEKERKVESSSVFKVELDEEACDDPLQDDGHRNGDCNPETGAVQKRP